MPETRKQIETAYQSRCMDKNTRILEELVELRQKKADLLGYENHAHYVLEMRMAKSPKTVKDFLEGLATRLQPLWAKERQEILKLKEEEVHQALFLGIFSVFFRTLFHALTMSQTIPDIHGSSQIFPVSEGMSF